MRAARLLLLGIGLLEISGRPAAACTWAVVEVRANSPNAVIIPSDLERYYPERAQRFEKAGSVDLVCTASEGHLIKCSATTPQTGLGFERMAIMAAEQMAASPQASGEVSVHFDFVVVTPSANCGSTAPLPALP